MTEIATAPRPLRQQERHENRRDTFYSQTVAENNDRLNTKDSFSDLLEEIKFIEAELLSRLGDEI